MEKYNLSGADSFPYTQWKWLKRKKKDFTLNQNIDF